MDKEEAGVDKDLRAPEGTEVKKEDSGASAESVDYKVLYEKEHDRAENYKRSFKEKKEFREKAPESQGLDADTIRQIIREETAGNKVDKILNEKIKDPQQRELAKLYYENRINKQGTSDEAIADDLELAVNAVHGIKLAKQNAELRRAAENKPSNVSTEGPSSEKEVDRNNLSPELRRSLESKAKAVGQDPQKFIEKFLENQKRTTVVR